MKKIICTMCFVLLLATIFTACNGEQNDTSHQHTIEELGATIVAAGTFWEDFWAMRGIFAWENFNETPWEYWTEQPNHPRSRGFQRVLPTFVFQNINDVANHLSQFYTDEWVNLEIFGNRTEAEANEMLFGEPWAFEEYAGELYVFTTRIGTLRPNWETATHNLIEQNGNIALVETTVFAYDHMDLRAEMPTATFLVMLIDGRIESGHGQWDEWGLTFHDASIPQFTHDPNEFYGIDPIAELVGTWENPAGDTLAFPMPGTTVGDITRMPNGAFVVQHIWNGGGDSRVWLFPAGVEMIRYNWHWERMPYNPYVVSDTSAWRLFNGDFEVTSCCTDETINATLFFRHR